MHVAPPPPTDPEVCAAIVVYAVNVASGCDHTLDHLDVACPYVVSDRVHDAFFMITPTISIHDGHGLRVSARKAVEFVLSHVKFGLIVACVFGVGWTRSSHTHELTLWSAHTLAFGPTSDQPGVIDQRKVPTPPIRVSGALISPRPRGTPNGATLLADQPAGDVLCSIPTHPPTAIWLRAARGCHPAHMPPPLPPPPPSLPLPMLWHPPLIGPNTSHARAAPTTNALFRFAPRPLP